MPLRLALMTIDEPPASAVGPSAAPSGPVSCDAAMATIASGRFTMGSMKERDEQPMHDENVAAFCLDKAEVTAKAYAACVEAGGCMPPKLARDECNYRKAGREGHPINCLSLGEAEAFCKAQGKRLPSEIEWELAARGREGRTYPWGEEEDVARACADRAKDGTCDAGQMATDATKEGLIDMGGNVAEWTSSLYGSAYDATPHDYDNAVRGGSYRSRKPTDLRGATRRGESNKPERADVDVGVRCAK